jgi:hypothetical protein
MEVANKLKMWITDPLLPIEEKFVGGESKRNSFNLMFTSNDERPVIVERDDRRYTIFHSRKFDRAIAARIHHDTVHLRTQVAAFFQHLLERKVRIEYGTLYATEARETVQESSLPSEEIFVTCLKEDGWYSVAEGWRAAANPNAPRDINATVGNNGIPGTTLLEVYRDFCRQRGIRQRGPQMLGKALKNAGAYQARERQGGVITRCWYGVCLEGTGVILDFPQPKKLEAPVPVSADFNA